MKCARCGKEINKVVPNFNYDIDYDKENVHIKEEMQFVCEECDNKRYEQLKEIFDGKSSSIHDK